MTFKRKHQEARFKRLSLHLDFSVEMYLKEAMNPDDVLIRYRFSDQNHPNGFDLDRIYHDYINNTINFVFYDDTWDIVPDGSIIPDIDPGSRSTMTIEVFKVTNDTKIYPVATTSVSNYHNLPMMF